MNDTIELIEPVRLLRILRLRKNWTQQQCAEKLGTTYSALRAWESGHRTPTQFGQEEILRFVKRNK